MSSRKAVTKLQAAIIVVIIIVAVICAAAYFMYAPPAPTPTPSEIRIGAVFALSGWDAVTGRYNFYGTQLAVKWLNDQGGINLYGKKIPVKLIYYDDESSVDIAVKLTEKLIVEDKTHFLIVPSNPERSIATIPIAEKYKVVSIGGAGADVEYLQGFKYFIGPYPPGSTVFRTSLKLIREADPEAETIAFFLSSADVGGYIRKSVYTAAAEYGYRIIYDRVYPADITDASPMLREIAALKPDIIIGGTIGPASWTIATQIRDLKVYAKWIALFVFVGTPEFGQTLGKWAVGFMTDRRYEPEIKWEIVAAREGKEYIGPTNDEILTYWSAMGHTERIREQAGFCAAQIAILAKCVELAQSLDSDKIMAAALSLDVYTCMGRFKLDPTNPAHQIGQESYPIAVQWQKKDNELTFEILYPYEFATAKPIPMPTWEEKETWPELELKIK